MLNIENGVVYLTKGDDAVIEIELGAGENGEDIFEMTEQDILTLTVREKPSADYEALLKISSNPGSNRIVIRAPDTKAIKVGRYSADIQLTTADGKIHTVWPELTSSSRYKVKNLKNFVIMPEVTIP